MVFAQRPGGAGGVPSMFFSRRSGNIVGVM
jgi:hypothetical protein